MKNSIYIDGAENIKFEYEIADNDVFFNYSLKHDDNNIQSRNIIKNLNEITTIENKDGLWIMKLND